MVEQRPSRGGSPTRGVTRVKSKSHEALTRSRSNDRQPSRGESKLRALSHARSDSQKNPPSRSRSNDRRPDREESKLRALSRSRSGSPGRRPPGRSKSSESLGRRPPGRSKSSDSLAGGRKPPTRSSSFGAGDRRPPQRTNSFGNAQDRAPLRGVRRARSMSPMRGTNHSRGSSVGSGPRGRSIDPASRHRSRSRSRSADRFSDDGLIGKEYPSQRPRDNRVSKRSMARSFRRIKQIGGGREKGMSWGQLCHYVIPLAVILGASVGLLFAAGKGKIITDAIDKIKNKFENSEILDPLLGAKAPHWPRTGNGVEVTVINALTPDWQITFDLAITDWATGSPKAVEITTIQGDPDPDCEAPDGTVIICNKDHGDLKWRGVNEAVVLGNVIVSTTAKMNEYYLAGMDKGAWQYTCCHELGHAIGLGHSDESFDNPDLGTCMDYTDNLNANKHPNQSNYDRLVKIYGEYNPNGRKLGVPQMSVQHLRKRDQDYQSTAVTVPNHIQQRKKEAVEKLYRRVEETYVGDNRHNTPVGHTHEDGWKLVHRRHLGEEHELELGEGYKVRVQFFLVH